MNRPAESVAAADHEPDLLRVATAGSVDDGKSTLIGRLLLDAGAIAEDHLQALRRTAGHGGAALDLSLVTDGLRAEREQAITIDVAYRYFATARRRFIVADTPGHEQYTRNMATGASTADLAIILVDATQGAVTQSRRHAFITSLLGVPRIVVAINKMDLVEFREDVFDHIRRDFSAFAQRLGFVELAFIPVSALAGDNVVEPSARMPWYRGAPLLTHLENVYIGGDRNLIDFRFPVQRVMRPDATFRGYGGQVVSGVVRPGDEVVALPSGRRTRVRRIVTADGDLDYAFAPLAVTLCLEDELDISRGDMLAHPHNVPTEERRLDAMLVWMSDRPLRKGQPYIVKHTTVSVKAVCADILYRVDPDSLRRQDAAQLELNHVGRVSLTLFRPLYADAYRRNRATGSFIVIDPVTHDTAAAGMIVDRHTAAAVAGDDEHAAPVSRDIGWETGKVDTQDRMRLLRQRAVTVWLTGLSGAGKSTLARELELSLVQSGHACYVLDGDNLRHGLSRDLGFSPEHRRENIRRVAEVARLMNEAGVIVLTAFISPYAEDRAMARRIVGDDRFVEVFVDADLDTCERRDPKGLYRKARAGEIEDFTGIDAPYERPLSPELTLGTSASSIAECVGALRDHLGAKIRV